MTIQLLKYIAAVAEAGSITEAAKTMHISQPSLSSALKEAEKELGFGIFTRSRSGIFPAYLQGREIISVPLAEKDRMRIGYVLCRGQSLSELGSIYVEALKKYAPQDT